MKSPSLTDAKALEAKAEEAARLLDTIANKRRLMILCRLADGECSVGELAPIVGLGQSALSQHLARLRADGIVATRREAQTIFYRLDSPAAIAVINTLADIFCRPDPPEARE